jgi:nucleoid DNA-binding protein
MGHNQNILADKISKELGLSKQTGRKFLQKVLKTISNDIVYTGHMELNGIGTFSIIKRSSQTINHPETGQPINVPQKKILTFRSSTVIRRRLNPPKPVMKKSTKKNNNSE